MFVMLKSLSVEMLPQIRQLLVLFLSTVTVVFQDMYPAWGSVLATSILAFGMLGIEEIGRFFKFSFELCCVFAYEHFFFDLESLRIRSARICATCRLTSFARRSSLKRA